MVASPGTDHCCDGGPMAYLLMPLLWAAAPAFGEGGPFNSVRVEVMDPIEHMNAHVRAGDKVWVRRRRAPLTAEQSAQLTAFVERQEGKPFAVVRLLGQVTPFRSRGPLRTRFVGKPH